MTGLQKHSMATHATGKPSAAAAGHMRGGTMRIGKRWRMAEAPEFDADFRARLRDLIVWRRDVRRFRREPLPQGTLHRLLELACLAPSVGLSQPWRFVIVDSPARRNAVRECFETCNADALADQARSDPTAERAALYARLKLEGLDEAPCQVAVFADRATPLGHRLGRLTMPEMVDYSAVLAVHTLWLAARAEGIGVGWLSILDPSQMTAILEVPSAWTFIGYFCVGYPAHEDDTPALEQQGWENRRRLSEALVQR